MDAYTRSLTPKNNAGGDTFTIGPWARLDRFLALGTEGGTYYQTEQKLTAENTANLQACVAEDPLRVLGRVVHFSVTGRAARVSPVLFALAYVAKRAAKPAQRAAAYRAADEVVRTGSHLLQWTGYLKSLGGLTSGYARFLRRWYEGRTPEMLAYQMVKYRNRHGWTQRDILRQAHIPSRTLSPERDAIIRWVMRGRTSGPEVDASMQPSVPALPRVIQGFDRLQVLASVAEPPSRAVEQEVVGWAAHLPWEAIPSTFHTSAVWASLLPGMPATAFLRNLARLASRRLLDANEPSAQEALRKIKDVAWLRASRIHPLHLLQAQTIYSRGRGDKGSLTWTPNPQIVAALGEAFVDLFNHLDTVSDCRICIGVDVSGSMASPVAGSGVSAEKAARALAYSFLRASPEATVLTFTEAVVDVTQSWRARTFDQVLRTSYAFGGTDAALPIRWARERRAQYDLFIVITDNEHWAGPQTPAQALAHYRKLVPHAKLAVVALTATNFSVADPNDPGMLDYPGFDPSVYDTLLTFGRLR